MASVGEADPKVVQQTVLSTPGAGASTAQPSSHTNSYASADPVASGDMSIHEAVSIQEPTATTALLSRESSFVAGSQGPTRSVLAASDPTTNPDKRGTDLGRYSMSSMRYTCAAARPSDLRRSLLEDTAEASKATGMELVASLHEATNRVHQELQARAAALEAARRAFEQEVDTKRASLMAQEFEVMRSANQLRREQEAWCFSRHRSELAEVEQQASVRIKAGDSTFITTAAVLMQREPTSALALLVRKLLSGQEQINRQDSMTLPVSASVGEDTKDLRSTLRSNAKEGGGARAGEDSDCALRDNGGPEGNNSKQSPTGLVTPAGGAGGTSPITLVLDRDAGTVAFLLEWFRDGEVSLQGMPSSMLRRLQTEAAHWSIRSLEMQCASRLGSSKAEGDQQRHYNFLLTQLEEGMGSSAICRVVISEVWKWLAESQSRRELACAHRTMQDGSYEAQESRADQGSRVGLMYVLADALEKHPTDGVLQRVAFGCFALLGATCATARPVLAYLRSRLEAAAEKVQARVAEPVGATELKTTWIQAVGEVDKFRRVLKLCPRPAESEIDCIEGLNRTPAAKRR